MMLFLARHVLPRWTWSLRGISFTPAMSKSGVAGSNRKVILGTADLGRNALTEDSPVSKHEFFLSNKHTVAN